MVARWRVGGVAGDGVDVGANLDSGLFLSEPARITRRAAAGLVDVDGYGCEQSTTLDSLSAATPTSIDPANTAVGTESSVRAAIPTVAVNAAWVPGNQRRQEMWHIQPY